MAIQFHCSGCGEPIEVDEPHAGQTAACPYCNQVINVPAASTYEPPSDVPVARGIEESSSAPDRAASSYAARPTPPTTDRQRSAITFGNYALALSALAIAMFLGVAIVAFAISSQLSDLTPGSPSDFNKITEQLQNHPATFWANILTCGMVVFALGGLSLGIYSVTLRAQENWRGWLAVVASGLFVLFVCGGGALMILTMGGGLG